MTEIAVYGLPVRMPHWSFGVRYIHQLVRQSMGHSKIFEVMFPGDPVPRLPDGRATRSPRTRWSSRTSSATPTSRRTTSCSRASTRWSGGNIVEQAAAHAHRIEQRDRRVRPGARRGGARRRARAGVARRRRPASCTARAIPRIRAPSNEAASERRLPASASAPCPGESEPPAAAAGQHARARSRRTRNTTCCGSSPTTRPSSSSGSATSSSRCAPSRSTSTRCSPARS